MVVGLEVGPYGKCAKRRASAEDDAPADAEAETNDAESNTEVFRAGKVGASCGGDWNYMVQCAPGLICHKPTGLVSLAGGQCLPLSQDGQQCGGGTRYANVCKPNSDCTYPNGSRPGRKGVCEEHLNGEGEECGGAMQYSFRCKAGFRCVKLNDLKGGQAVCRRGPHEESA